MASHDKVPIAPVHQHVTQLMAWGMDAFMIAHATGEYVTNSTITNIRSQRYGNVLADVAEAVLAVGPQPVPYCPIVLSIGTQRRIRALARRGWTAAQFEELADLPSKTVSQIMNRKTVRYSTWLQVRDVYEPLSASPDMGPSLLAAERSKAKKWPTPMDWEVVDIDHPGQTPDRARSLPELDAEDRRERVWALTRQGYSAAVIAIRLGITERTVCRDRALVRTYSDELRSA
jgi:hypothetical protein